MTPKKPTPGDLIAGRYRLVKQLGAGGFGVVFQARQESMGRDVAIKLLQPKISDDDIAIERFRREAFQASSLRHPHTITLHDYGRSDDGIFYIVMELLEGTVLGKAIFKEGGLVLGRALRIGSMVLKSLGEAHRKGLVHRDLKPENIFLLSDVLGEKDYVKVLDFGLSKAVSEKQSTYDEPTLTQHGKVFGTPYYMSPEQAYGDEVTPAADVFAFGLLFYEMLVGQRPFRGKTAFDVLTKLTKEPLPRLPPPLVNSSVQHYLDVLTAKDLESRYTDAVAALEPLERLLSGDARAELGDIDQLYVGRKPGLRRELRASEPTATPPPPVKTPTPAPLQPGQSSTRRVDVIAESRGGAQQPGGHASADLLGELFAPEELAASMEHFAKKSDRHPRMVRELQPDEQTIVRPKEQMAPPVELPRGPRRHGYGDVNAPTVIHRPEISDSDDMPTVVRQISRVIWTDVPLFGRESELSSLLLSAQQLLNGSGGFLVIEGEAGIGKSRLITELKSRLEEQGRFRVVRGSYAQDGGSGFGAGLRDAIEQVLGIKGIGDEDAFALARRRFAQLGITEDVQILMRLLRPWLSPDRSAWFNIAAAPTAYHILETLLVREAREHGFVFILEDIQWADPLLTGFAEHLVRSAEGRMGSNWPLLLICTQRHDELLDNAELSTAVNNVGRALGTAFAHLKLKALTEATVHALVRQVMDLEPRVRTSLASISRGNPFYILQGLRYLDSLKSMEDSGRIRRGSLNDPKIPGSVDALVHERLNLIFKSDRGHPLASEMIRAAAVLGHRFSHDLLQRYLVHMGRSDMVAVLAGLTNDLQEEGFLVREPNTDPVTYRFSHSLVREALMTRLRTTPDYERFNEAAARAKELDASTTQRQGAEWLADVASHWRAAGEKERAFEFTLRQAKVAETSWDLKTAQTLYRSIEDDLSKDNAVSMLRYEVLLALGRLSSRQGELGPAEDLLQAASGTARRLENARGEGKAMVILGKLHTWQSRHREALSCFRQAIACFSSLKNTTHIDMAGLAEAQFGQAEVARVRGDLSGAENEFLRALDKARQSEAPEVEAHCLQGLGRTDHVRGKLGKAISSLREAQKQFESCGLPIEAATAAADLALSELYVSGRAKALETLTPALDTLRLAEERLSVAHAKVHEGVILSRGTRIDDAAEACEEAQTIFRALHHTYGVAKATLLRGELNAIRQERAVAWTSAKEALRVHESIGDAHGAALCLLRLGSWAVDSEKLTDADERLSRALEIIEEGALHLYRPVCRIELGRIELLRGNADGAFRHFTEAYNEARSAENREAAAEAATRLGALALIRGYAAEARAYLETGITEANKLETTRIQVLAHLNMAWLESSEGKTKSRQRIANELSRLIKSDPSRDWGLDRHVKRAIRAIELVRGASEAQRYRRAATEVLKSV